jgi:hypothetical protein
MTALLLDFVNSVLWGQGAPEVEVIVLQQD